MSDYNSSLPVRTQSPGDVVAIIADATIPSQQLAVDSSGKITTKLDDAAGNGITSQANGSQQALDVGINVAGVQIDPRDIRALTSADVVSARIEDSAGNALTSTGSALDVNLKTSSITLPVSGTVTADQGAAAAIAGAWPVLPTDGTNSQSFTAAGEAKVDITQPLPAGSNAIGSVLANLQVASSPVSTSNPVPVSIASATPGIAVQSYASSAALAAAASANIDYTVTAGKTLSLERIFASASGKIKALIAIETGVATGVFTTKFVGFNSTATPNIDISVMAAPSVAAGVRVRVTITNNDLQAMDVYATIEGNEF